MTGIGRQTPTPLILHQENQINQIQLNFLDSLTMDVRHNWKD